MRVLQKAGFEAFLGAGRLVAHDAGKQAHDRIEQRQRRGFAARQDEVAERDFLEVARVDDALVDALEATADDDRARAGRELRAPGPGSAGVPRGLIARRAGVALRRGVVDGAGHDIGPHDMPAPPPAGVSSTVVMAVGREIADLHGVQRPGPGLQRAPGER